jgi:hypothetical protein
VQPRIHAVPDRGHRGGLGKDFGVRADADLEILAPGALLDERRLQGRGFGRAGPELGKVLADESDHLAADRGGGVRVAPRALLDDALQHRDRKGDPGRLHGLQVDGASSQGFLRVAPVGRRVGQDVRQRPESARRGLAQGAGRSAVSHKSRIVG